LEAAEVLGDHNLVEKIKAIALKMAAEVAKNGIDTDGALVNEGEDGKIVDYDKHWWPQTEAIVGFVNAWNISGDEQFIDKALGVWSFTRKKIIDGVNGEWYFRVDRNGVPYADEDKVGPWKCPYHNGRACFEIIERYKSLNKS
jgi:mannobiose 2-epimerase